MNIESSGLHFQNVPRVIPEISDEVIEQGGVRAVMKIIQESFSSKKLKPEIDKRRSGVEESQGAINTSPNRVEILGIGGYFAEKVFERAREWWKKHPDALGSGRFINGTFKPIPYAEIEKMFDKDPAGALRKLKEYSFDTLFAQEEELFNALEESIAGKQGEALTYEERAYERYRLLLEASGFNQINNTNEPNRHVRSGLDTANGLTWAILEGAPNIFMEQYGRAPTAVEMGNLVKASRDFVLFLGTLEEGTFSAIQEQILSSIAYSNPQIQDIFIHERNGAYEFDIKPTALRKVVDRIRNEPGEVNDERIRMGCPALAARGADGKNLVAELHDWLAGLAWKFYYPRVLAGQKEG